MELACGCLKAVRFPRDFRPQLCVFPRTLMFLSLPGVVSQGTELLALV